MAEYGRVYYRELAAGILRQTEDGYVFTYLPGYLAMPEAQPVSLTLPLRDLPYNSPTLFAFFDGLIPEGWLLNLAVTHWKVRAYDRFELLLLTCRDTIGAVTIVPEEEEADHV